MRMFALLLIVTTVAAAGLTGVSPVAAIHGSPLGGPSVPGDYLAPSKGIWE